MQKIYLFIIAAFSFCIEITNMSFAQVCSTLNATTTSYESRCAATGSIKIFATGGSGSYKYKVTGPVNTTFTSTDSITGLAAGVYSVVINDIVSNCTFTKNNVTVMGSYQDPRFTMNGFDVTCDNGNNGRITLNTQDFGRAPFGYSIIAPSPTGVGSTSSIGTFNNLVAGIYTIRMTDSCGGIQTRLITINNYTWKIDSFSFKKISCDSAVGTVTVSDSKGNISTIGGLPGFTYGIVRGIGDTIWSSNAAFAFYLNGKNSFEVVVKDPCGKIKKGNAIVNFKPTVSTNPIIFNRTCSTFSVRLTGIINFFNPTYCLFDKNNQELACNRTGIFTNLPYGNYCINANDSCSDTTIIRCFNSTPPPISVGSAVLIFNKKCTTFSASITGQSGLTIPKYCLKDSIGNTLQCNATGIFNNLSYGKYCISIRDSCRDTTIIRCFKATRPTPVVPSIILPAYNTCTVFGLLVVGDSLTNPSFCIYDSLGVLITCNTTGKFDSLFYGNYCIKVHDSCFDTTIVRCISILGPSIKNDIAVNSSNKNCTSFSVNISGGGSLINPTYCLYDNQNIQVGCTTNGSFSNLPYGTYCLKVKNSCPDTTFNFCFTEKPPAPSLNNNVVVSNKTCTTFDVKTSGEQNFTNPKYCIYDINNVELTCNFTGIFTNLNYGNYCIKIKDGCYDTLVTRCFNALPTPVKLAISSKKSCTPGYALFGVTVTASTPPINIKIYNSNGVLFFNRNFNVTSLNIDSIPGGLLSQKNKIVVTDNCGNKDSVLASAIANLFTKVTTVKPLCPSSTWINGSGTIATKASSNIGPLTVRLIKKNGIALSPFIVPSTVLVDLFSFNNLQPATYIIQYKVNNACNNNFYDTVTIAPYQYPNLDRSSVYQCDLNGFSIGAVVSNGVGPFQYEIIGSTPSTPVIITSPQSSPLFNINNGFNYSLVRLRATDVCGNATLEDASILPLTNNGISATFNCFQLQTTLSVDTIYNATYAWYKKSAFNSADSVLLGTAKSLYIPFVLPSDTGYYVCNIVVNSGCVKRRYYFHLNGACAAYLPLAIENFTGKYVGNKVVLNWEIAANIKFKKFIIERKNDAGQFTEIGTVIVPPNASQNLSHNYLDTLPGADKNYYRLKLVNYNNTFIFSKIILLSKKVSFEGINIYPNPVNDRLTVEFRTSNNHSYKIKLLNLLNQVVYQKDVNNVAGNKLQIIRTNKMSNGVYILRIFDKNSQEDFSQKVIFQ